MLYNIKECSADWRMRMKCRDFQKIIPQIIDRTVPDYMLDDVVTHVRNCKDCYDELEIYFVLKFGLYDDNQSKTMDFIGELDNNLTRMEKRSKLYEVFKSTFHLIRIMTGTAVVGSLIYVFFNIL